MELTQAVSSQTNTDLHPVLNATRSGGASVNEYETQSSCCGNLVNCFCSGFFHACMPTLAFGGVGNSGQGSYRGKASFDCFTHRRSVTTTPSWMESMLTVRYPPYEGKQAKFERMSKLTPNFDREGRVKSSMLTWLTSFLSLGADNKTDAAKRYLVVLLGKFIVRGTIGVARMLTRATQ